MLRHFSFGGFLEPRNGTAAFVNEPELQMNSGEGLPNSVFFSER
jgi:hypothetical protein